MLYLKRRWLSIGEPQESSGEGFASKLVNKIDLTALNFTYFKPAIEEPWRQKPVKESL